MTSKFDFLDKAKTEKTTHTHVLEGDLYVLATVLHEEVLAQGGAFVSMESDIWFKQRFQQEYATPVLQLLEQLIKKYEQRET
jgi:uncharacterized protein (AIM24 family)